MAKVTKHISLDPDVVEIIKTEKKKGLFCLSSWVNDGIREKYLKKEKRL